MELCIVYGQSEGKVAVVHPVPLARLCSAACIGAARFSAPQRVPLGQLIGRSEPPTGCLIIEGETDQEFAERIAARMLPPEQERHIVRAADLPPRSSRDTWKLVEGKVVDG